MDRGIRRRLWEMGEKTCIFPYPLLPIPRKGLGNKGILNRGILNRGIREY